ncbi:hypothetical protein MVEN_02282800 [Mycena venus]|uniref:Uncharacterized protein n=1 Tax=Mycena venus TaxID=2733690 RepID=A0A8H6X4V8_9AGAR|nr:hypothetical protein MVEN_02282800 [Mycena venus]
MPADRQRVVYKEWVRDPKGKLLEKPPPKGSRTENNIIWGHTLHDFYWIPRIPGVNVLTIWSRSMIKEYGENYLNEKHEKEPEPRRLRPWPVLTLPDHVSLSSKLGCIDEGCGDNHEHPLRRIQDETPNAAPVNYLPLEAPENLVGAILASAVSVDSRPPTDPPLSAALNADSPAVAPPPGQPAFSCTPSYRQHFPPASPIAQEPTLTSNSVAAESVGRTAPIQVDTNPAPSLDNHASSAQVAFEACSTTPTSATLVSTPAEDVSKITSWPSDSAERIDMKIALPTATDAAPVAVEVVVATEAGTPCTRAAAPLPDAPAPVADAQAPDADVMDVDAPKVGDGAAEGDKPGNDKACAVDADPQAPTSAAQAPATAVIEGDASRVDAADVTAVDAPKGQDGVGEAEKLRDATNKTDVAAAAPTTTTQTQEEFKAILAKEMVEAVLAEAKKTPPRPPTPKPIFHDLPKLEEFIPEEYFPDILYVNDPDEKTTLSYYYHHDSPAEQSVEPVPRKYKRVWPRFARDTEPATAFNTDPDCASIKVLPLPTASGSSQPSTTPRTSSPTVPKPETNLRIAQLNLSSAPRLGTGNHSAVFRAGLRLPHQLSARSPTGEVTVAAKTGFSGDEARRLLNNEGKIYGAFPKHLQEDWCGLDLVAPITHPVPVHAVVPKFYGYYVPVMEDVERAKQEAVRAWKEKKKEKRHKMKEADAQARRRKKAEANRAKAEEAAKAEKEKAAEGGGQGDSGAVGKDEGATQSEDANEEEEDIGEEQEWDEEEKAAREDEEDAVYFFTRSASYKAWHRLSPILLLEECGEPISPSAFTADERSECFSLALRLHYAEFTQNSFYVRNILRQPGPLTVAPSDRSNKTPSFRIIDHGRGEHWSYQLEKAKKENEERRRRNKSKTELRALMNVPTEAEMKKRIKAEEAEDEMDKKHLEAAAKSWWESRDYEVRKAHSELQIRDFDY